MMIHPEPEANRDTALQRFAAPSLAAPAIWRLLAALALMFGGLILLGIGIGAATLAFGLREQTPEMFQGFETPASALFILGSFLIWRPAIWLAIRLFCRRAYRTLFGPEGRVAWPQFLTGVLIAAVIAALSTGVAWALVGTPTLSAVNPALWVGFAAIALPLIYIQSSAEEMLFRGLILQHMAARFGAFWAWGLLPSVLFGLLHWNPDGYGVAAWIVLLITGLTGLIFALVTAATGNLGLAMGLHFGLNVYALLLVAPNAAFSALALSYWPVEDETLLGLLVIDLAALIIACAGAALWYRRSQRQ